MDRVTACQQWVERQGFSFFTTPSPGMDQLVRMKKGFPRQGMQFCTQELKIYPAQHWLSLVDPNKTSTCLVGVRREESKARSQWPEYVEESDKHGGRPLWAPLVRHDTAERDALLRRAGFAPLPHRSKECDGCVNNNRADMLVMDEQTVQQIKKWEQDIGKTFYRPYRHMGAVGIDEVMDWARAPRGKYKSGSGRGKVKPSLLSKAELSENDGGSGCDSGMCGT
jgi:hypothetical protein